jgi:hypothetical protein
LGTAIHARVFLEEERLSSQQTLNGLTFNQMGLNDLFNVIRINKGIPGTLWVNHHHGSKVACIKAARFVDANPACPRKPELFNAIFGVRK